MERQPRVGIGVLLVRTDTQQVLAGRRKGKVGRGEWALPGGHLEYGETFEECGAREVLEETGVVLTETPKFAHAVNTIFSNEAHYVTIFMRVDVTPEEAEAVRNAEPDKCEGWEWHFFEDLPKPIFLPLLELLKTEFKL